MSGRRIATALRAEGHDVLALNEEGRLQGLDDPDVLALAAPEGRVLVTFNHRHFVPLLREWAEARRRHAGSVIVYGIDHREFGLTLRGLAQLFAQWPGREAWLDTSEVLSRSRAP